MNVKKNVFEFKKIFDFKLERFLLKKENQAKKLAPGYSQAIAEIRRLNRAGGKRLRPFFIWTGFKACQGRNDNLAWQACLSMELDEAFALLHDDIMDNARLRRGKLTCYQKLGLNKAILVGDVALALAEEIIPQKAKPYFDLMNFELIGGQYLDVSRDKGFNESKVTKIMELKTAMYTIARPLQIGGALAGADKKTLDAFYSYGKNLGIAFQIQDDILGIFGDKETLGKPVGSDIAEGKKTLLMARRLKDQRHKLKIKDFFDFFGSGSKITKQQLKLTRNLLKESGALKYCQQKAVYLAKLAKKTVVKLKIRQTEKEFLLQIGDYVITRNN